MTKMIDGIVDELDTFLFGMFASSGLSKEDFKEIVKQEIDSIGKVILDRIGDW